MHPGVRISCSNHVLRLTGDLAKFGPNQRDTARVLLRIEIEFQFILIVVDLSRNRDPRGWLGG